MAENASRTTFVQVASGRARDAVWLERASPTESRDSLRSLSSATIIAIVLAAASTTLVNVAYLREHDAAAQLPALSMRRPLQSVRLLLEDHSWLVGFAMESSGFLLYAAALALAPLALVQSISAGGIGVLAYVSARLSGRRLGPRHRAGVIISTLGLLALGISLVKASGDGHNGSILAIVIWLGGCALLAVVALAVGRHRGGSAVADGVAGGLFFSIGDVSTKLATEGGVRVAFVVTLIAGYSLGSLLLQLGYQRGAALTVAGVATLLTNALPIAAGTTVLGEPLPGGALGAARIIAFVGVIAGSILLAAPERPPPAKPGSSGSSGLSGSPTISA
jgi:hypothetical protein